MAKPKPKKVRADELWPGDVIWFNCGLGQQWGTFLVRVLNVTHKHYVNLEIQHLSGETQTVELVSFQPVEVFPRPIVRPQANFSVD